MKLIENENSFTISGEVRCQSCGGTGLYNGIGEGGGACVICNTCKGTGKNEINISYDKFKGREKREDCERVYTKGMGYKISSKDTWCKGEHFPFHLYGCTYEEWLNGKKPIPLKFLGCPYQETNQSLQSHDVNNLYKTRCDKGLGWGRISNCKFHYEKHICWKIYDGETK